MVIEIKLINGITSIIDDVDEVSSQHIWYAHKTGKYGNTIIYAERTENGKHVQLHNEIMERMTGYGKNDWKTHTRWHGR